MDRKDVDWEDPALKRWLDTIMRSGTKRNYRSAFRAYAQFTGMTGSALIEEALNDAKKDPMQKGDVVLKRLIGFYKWLKTEYPKKSRGRGSHRIIGKGISDKNAHMYVSAARSFYGTFNVTVRLKGRHRLPKARVENKRMKVAAEQVKVLVDHARTPRDRAIILTLFQSGIDVSTLCGLKYKDVAEGLKNEEHPLKLELFRPKTGVEFYTFLGKDAVEAVKVYLADLKARNVKVDYGTSLFLKERGKQGLTPNLVQNMMRSVALKAGFVDEKNNGRSFNPLGPHALRESFGSIMINSGVPDTIVDFWLGHEIGQMAEAYKGVQHDSLKQMYLDREKLLSISTPEVDVEELEAKVRSEVEKGSKQLQTLVNGLAAENIKLREAVTQLKSENAEFQQKMERELRKIKSELQAISD